MVYCTKSDDQQAKNLGTVLSNKDNLQLICIKGDVLLLLQNFERRLENDDFSVMDIILNRVKKFLF